MSGLLDFEFAGTGLRVQDFLAGRDVAKAVLVPGRLINLVTRRSE